MPRTDGWLTSRDICNQAVIERVLQDESVTSIKISATLQSDNFSSGSAGWQIRRDTGSAEFQDVTIRGTITAGSGSDVDWSFISNVAINNADVVDLSADKIDAGTLSADRIAARALSVAKLKVGSVDNLVQDPGFEQASTISGSIHQFVGSGGTWEYFTSHASARSGGNFIRYDPSGQTGTARIRLNGAVGIAAHPSVAEGDQLYFEFYAARDTTGTTNDILARIDWYDEDDSFISASGGTRVNSPAGYTKVSVEATAPAGVAFAVLQVAIDNDGNTTPIRIDDCYARRQVGAAVFEADLQSDNFSSGSAGWQIRRDTGNVEFNDGTFRGTLEAAKVITASSGDRIEIDPGVDQQAIFFYEGATQVGELIYTNGDNTLGIHTEASRHIDLSSAGTITIEGESPTTIRHRAGTGLALTVNRGTATTTDDVFELTSSVSGSGTRHFLIEADGDTFNTNNSYGSLSDERLKTNIQPSRRYLDDLRKIEVTKHELRGQELLGPIAQQVQAVFPGLVTEGVDGYLRIKHSVFVPMLITAVQELADRVEALEK